MGNKVFSSPESRLRFLIWISILLMAAADIIAGKWLGFHLQMDNKISRVLLLYGIFFPVATMAISLAFRYKWPDPIAANGIEAIVQFIVFVSFAVPLSYIAASNSFPYRDDILFQADKMLGFDWIHYVSWVNTHLALNWIFIAGYNSSVVQILSVIILLALTRQSPKMYGFVLGIIVCALLCIFISSVFPATGAYAYLHINKTDYPNVSLSGGYLHVDDLSHLHDGTMHTIPVPKARGLISFPSFHACTYILLIWAFWSIPILRWPLILLNIATLGAIPVNGGHYLVDVIAGSLIAIAMIFAVKLIANQPVR